MNTNATIVNNMATITQDVTVTGGHTAEIITNSVTRLNTTPNATVRRIVNADTFRPSLA
ncbi:MAG TPA: hypothetical protein GXX34_04120 [Clostridia bacterium]|nr:hypothetical protein [Clostridia bacterium]